MSKVALIPKILHIASHPWRNYGPSNLLFPFSDSCMCHLNKMQTEIAVMLIVQIFERIKDFRGPTDPFAKLHGNAFIIY